MINVSDRQEMEFFVEGNPQGKARPRFSHKTGTVYTPSKTAEYEKKIQKSFLAAGGKLIPGDCYVHVSVDSYFEVPKSYTKGKRLACQHNINRPAKKPDIDNVLKAVLDALNGVAYVDDRQVIEVRCRKWYAQSTGCLKISIREVHA